MSKGYVRTILEVLCRKLMDCQCCVAPTGNKVVDTTAKYRSNMFGPRSFEFMGKDYEKARVAFYLAHDIRMFEIELYWKRALYFWGFQAAIFLGFAALADSDSVKLVMNGRQAPSVDDNFYVSYFLICLFSSIGLITSVAWLFANKGSKAWQENWETHIDFLEDCFSGSLHKTIIMGKENFYSVSKLNEFVSCMAVIIWAVILFGLLYFNFKNMNAHTFLQEHGVHLIFFILAIAFFKFICIVCSAVCRCEKPEEEVEFRKRKLPHVKNR